MTAQRETGFALSSSSNSEPNLLQLVSLKRDCKGDRLLFVCLLFHQQSSIIVITLNIFGTWTLSSILVELHKMIGMLHAPDIYFFPTCLVDLDRARGTLLPMKAWINFNLTPSHNFVFSCDVNISSDYQGS